MLSSRSKVEIKMRHVFSCELNKDKHNYILEAFEDVEHVFHDCRVFSNGRGFCSRCQKEHPIDDTMQIDLLVVGPSCKDLSFLDSERFVYFNTMLCFVVNIYTCLYKVQSLCLYINIKYKLFKQLYIYIYVDR